MMAAEWYVDQKVEQPWNIVGPLSTVKPGWAAWDEENLYSVSAVHRVRLPGGAVE